MSRKILLVMLTVVLASCSGTGGNGGGPHQLPPGGLDKADDYVSTNAREFELVGKAHVVLPENFDTLTPEEKELELERLVERRLSVVARSIKRHIEDVVRSSNGEVSGEAASWFSYFRNDSAESEATRVLDDGRAEFSFSIELVGSVYLMSRVAPGTGVRSFQVEVKDFNETEGEIITVEIRGSTSRDAFPEYDQLFADGVFDIAIHFGGDYNAERLDIETAKWLVDHLLEGTWENPAVSTFDELKIDSPPFIHSVTIEGRPVQVRIYVYHSDMVTQDQEELLSEAMKRSLSERDVVIYSGHAGSGAGFILDYQPRHEIPASDFADLPLADKYQIYVLDGCMTYRTYVNDLMKNPRKTFDNLDIMTTVNTTPFSVGYQLIHEFLYWFTITDDYGNHYPLSWMTFLRGLNTRAFSSVHYGIHGIDTNPQLNPHASEGILCRACGSDTDCGAGGNFCLGYAAGPACGVACTTDTACPQGYRCARLNDDPELFYLPKQCVRRNYVCE